MPTTRVSTQPVPVYAPHTPSISTPDFHFDQATAHAFLVQKLADPINRGKAIRLRKKSLSLAIVVRGTSCHLKERNLIAAADGSEFAQSLIEGWSAQHHAVSVPRKDVVGPANRTPMSPARLAELPVFIMVGGKF